MRTSLYSQYCTRLSELSGPSVVDHGLVATHRADYEEWITTMTLPEADSLEDLVDFAIDTESGVIGDSTRNRFVVVGDECCYVYEPPVPLAATSAEPSTGTAPGSATTDDAGETADAEPPARLD